MPWQHRLSALARRGAVSVAALLLLALPASLGFMVAHNSIQVSQPLAVSRSFFGSTIAGNVLSPLTSGMPATGGGISPIHAATHDPDTDDAKKNLSSPIRVQPHHIGNGGHGHNRGHGHHHGDGQGDD